MENTKTLRNIYFNTTLNFTRLDPAKKISADNLPFYNGYFLLIAANIFKTKQVEDAQYTQSTSSETIRYFIQNILGHFPVQYREFEAMYFDNISQLFTGLTRLLYLSQIIVGTTLALSFGVSIFVISKIRAVFKEVFMSLVNIREHEFEQRHSEVYKVEELLKTFEASNFFEDMMGVSIKSQVVDAGQRSKKKAKKYKINCYCFGLAPTILLILGFFTIQIVAGAGKSLFEVIKMNSGIDLLSRIQNTFFTIDDQMVGYNSLMQELILNNQSTEVNNQSTSEYLKLWASGSSERNERVNKYRELGLSKISGVEFPAGITDFPSLCDLTPELIVRKDLCLYLDDKIALKGILQSNFRVNQYLDEIYSKYLEGKFTKEEILNDETFIDWKYTFMNVYLRSSIYMQEVLAKELNYEISLSLESYHKSFYYYLSVFIFGGIWTIIIIFLNIKEQLKRLVYSYKVLSVNIITENTLIKLCFLRLLRLSKKHF